MRIWLGMPIKRWRNIRYQTNFSSALSFFPPIWGKSPQKYSSRAAVGVVDTAAATHKIKAISSRRFCSRYQTFVFARGGPPASQRALCVSNFPAAMVYVLFFIICSNIQQGKERPFCCAARKSYELFLVVPIKLHCRRGASRWWKTRRIDV